MDSKRIGLISVHSSSLIFGGTALFSSWVSLPSSDITFWRSWVAALALFLLLRFRGIKTRLNSTRDTIAMVIAGILLGAHWITYFHAMQVSGVAVGIIALFTYPMFTVFIEPLFKSQHPHWQDILCAALVLLGVILLVPEFDTQNPVTQGILWCLFSALLFALRNVMQGHYLKAYRGETSMLYQAALAAMVCIPFLTEAPSNIHNHDWLLLLLLGCVFTALPHSLFATSLRYLKAKSVSLIACLQPVYGIALGVMLLSEQLAWTTLLGGALIVGTAAVETYRS